MHSLRLHGHQDVRFDEIPTPEPEPGWVQIRVAWCGICGSDLHEYFDGPDLIRNEPHPLGGSGIPVTLGHEFSGTISKLGLGVAGIAVGDRVAVDPCLRCGECGPCRTGSYNVCEVGGSIGLAAPGGMADYAVVPAYGIVPVPGNVSLEDASLAEPLAVGLHAAKRAGVVPGAQVCIIGAGPIGIATLLACRTMGAAQVVVVEPSPGRRDVARQVGATHTRDSEDPNLRRALYALTDRQGFDAVVEATGRPEQLNIGLNLLRRGGTIAVAGIGSGDAEIGMKSLVLYERTVVGSLGYTFDISTVLSLMSSGAISTDGLVSDRIELKSAKRVFEELARSRDERMKVLIQVGRSQ